MLVIYRARCVLGHYVAVIPSGTDKDDLQDAVLNNFSDKVGPDVDVFCAIAHRMILGEKDGPHVVDMNNQRELDVDLQGVEHTEQEQQFFDDFADCNVLRFGR